MSEIRLECTNGDGDHIVASDFGASGTFQIELVGESGAIYLNRSTIYLNRSTWEPFRGKIDAKLKSLESGERGKPATDRPDNFDQLDKEFNNVLTLAGIEQERLHSAKSLLHMIINKTVRGAS